MGLGSRQPERPVDPIDLPTGTVTLLFTDIEGSTRLVKRLRDAYGDVLAEHHRLLRGAFEVSEGREIDTQGDSFFVVFRSARQAIEGALAAQRALAEQRWPDGVEVRVRMGMHTAEPATSGAERYFGLGVHRAARICSAAHGGQILLSETTRALVEAELPADVSLRDLGEHRLKDLDHPERIHQVVAPGLPDAFPPLRSSAATQTVPDDDAAASNLVWLELAASSSFVGRVDELRAVDDAWGHAAAGHRVLVLLGGEPGIGKTTLAAEAARRVRDDGGMLLYGRWDEEVLAPYQAFREALGHYARLTPASILRTDLMEHAAEVSRLYPEVAERIGGGLAPLAGRAEAERLRLFEAVDAWIDAIASRRPVLLVLDDLHWADRPSILLLQHLMRAPRATPLLVVATYRDTDLDRSELPAALPALIRDTDCRRVTMAGLERADVVELMTRLTGGALAGRSEELARELQLETAGNPFFLHQLVQHLLETGRDFEIPETVRDVVRWRLERLAPGSAEVLAVASVIGEDFVASVLAPASGVDEDALLDLLESAARAGLVMEARDAVGGWGFSHSVVRRVLLDGLSRTRRIRIHRAVANALEGRPGTTPAELAYHFEEAGPDAWEKTIHYARAAGERAVDEAAYEAGVHHYRRAVEVLDRSAPDALDLRCDLLLELGAAHDKAGEYAARDERFVEAAEAARKLDDPARLVGAALGYGGVLPAAVRPDSRGRGLLEEALDRIGEDAAASRAHLLARLAHYSHSDRPYAEREEMSGRAVAMARETGDPATLAAVLVHRCWALDGPADVEEEFAIGGEVLEIGGEAADLELVLQGLRIRLAALFERGDFDAACETGQALAGLAHELRHPEYLRFATMWDIVVAATEGRFDEAEHLSGELHQRLQGIGHPQAELIYLAQTFSWRWLRGRAGDFATVFEALTAADPAGLAWQAAAAWSFAESGQRDRARDVLRRITPEAAASLDQNYLWWAAIVGFATAAAAVADRKWSDVLYRLALPFAGANCTLGVAGFHGAVDHWLGVLAATSGRHDRAVGHLERALDRHRAMRAAPFVALTGQELSDALTARDFPGDRERAASLHTSAIGSAEALGVTAVQERIARSRR